MNSLKPNNYFWRTYEQQEIDLIEEDAGKLHGYEIKYSKKSSKTPSQWVTNYPDASFESINQSNYLDFIS